MIINTPTRYSDPEPFPEKARTKMTKRNKECSSRTELRCTACAEAESDNVRLAMRLESARAIIVKIPAGSGRDLMTARARWLAGFHTEATPEPDVFDSGAVREAMRMAQAVTDKLAAESVIDPRSLHIPFDAALGAQSVSRHAACAEPTNPEFAVAEAIDQALREFYRQLKGKAKR